MIFLDYSEILPYAILFGIVIAAVWAFRAVSAKRLWIQILVRAFSIVLLMVATYFALLLHWFGPGKATRSAPIYSPDHSRAIRITHYEDQNGDTNGFTSVDLYSNFGLYSKAILLEEDSLLSEIKDVRWLSDSEVLINVQDVEREAGCKDAVGVKVRCELASVTAR